MDPNMNNANDFFERNKVKIAGALLVGGCYALFRKRYTAIFRGNVLKKDPNLKGKTIIISEPRFSQSYSGYFATKEFASRGAKVHVMVPQPLSLSLEAAELLKQETGNKDIHVHAVDLTSLRSIRKFANSFRERAETIDILINNADLYRPPQVPSEEEYPRRFVVNYLGRAILIQYLWECLKRSPNGKVLNVNELPYSANSQIVVEATQRESGMDYHLRHPEHFDWLYELQVYSYQMCIANKKFVEEMAIKLQNTNMTINQLEIEVRQSELMSLRLSSKIWEDLTLFYRHTAASSGKLIAYAALSEDFKDKSGAVLRSNGSTEQIRMDDSKKFFRHTSEVLETFEELFPIKPALENESMNDTV